MRLVNMMCKLITRTDFQQPSMSQYSQVFDKQITVLSLERVQAKLARRNKKETCTACEHVLVRSAKEQQEELPRLKNLLELLEIVQ